MADRHGFDVELAERYGIAEAILLDNLNFWLTKNRANFHNFFDGLWWTYNSIEAYSEMFPYLSESKIRNALSHLEREGLVKTGNYNKVKFDRTKWYALTEKGWALFGKTICENDLFHFAKTENGTSENSEPIPDGYQLVPSSNKGGGKFAPPTLEEVDEYAMEKGYSGFPSERFIAYYESNGWMVGRTKMKNWKAAMANWWNRDHPKQEGQASKWSEEMSSMVSSMWGGQNAAS